MTEKVVAFLIALCISWAVGCAVFMLCGWCFGVYITLKQATGCTLLFLIANQIFGGK